MAIVRITAGNTDDLSWVGQDGADLPWITYADDSAPLPHYGDEAERWDEENEPAFFGGSYQQSDATPLIEDAWDHFVTDDDEQPVADDAQLVVVVVAVVQYGGDDAEQLAQEDDEWAAPDEAQPVAPDVTQYHGEEAERWDEDVDFAHFGGSYQQVDVQPQLEDPWAHWDWEAADDEQPLADDYAGTGDSAPGATDGWDHFTTDDDEQLPPDDSPLAVPGTQYYGENAELLDQEDDEQVQLDDAQQSSIDATQYRGEDAELSDEDWDSAFFGGTYQQQDAAQQSPDDTWDHWAADDDEQPVPDDAQLVDVAAPGAIQYYGEDAECADADQDDDEWIARSADVLGDSVPVAVYYGEDAERLDSDDDEQWPFDELSQPLPLAQQFFGDEAEQLAAEDDEQTAGDDYALLDNAAPFADEWDHFVTDDDDQPPPDEFQQPLGTAPQTDGWDHFAGDDDEQWTLNEVLVATVVTAATQSPEDAWDHWDQVEDDYLLDDVQLLTAPVPLLLYGIGISFVIANGIVTQQRIYRTIPPWRANASNAWLGYRHAWGGAIK